jgi:mono/diheme cytochrome c family protein
MREMQGNRDMLRFLLTTVLLLLVPAGTVPASADTTEQRGGTYALNGGETIYQGICQGCHMAEAQGAEGAGRYPALASNPRLAGAAYVTHLVLRGQKGMPGFGDNLSDQQVADVVNYVRTHFGNRYDGAVTPADVRAARGK